MLKKKFKSKFGLLFLFLLAISVAGTLPITSEPTELNVVTPSVTVNNQPIVDDKVTIEKVDSDGPGWIVIHNQTGSTTPGSVLGFTAVSNGTNNYVVVDIQKNNRTTTLYAMLHIDDGTIGTYEFPSVPGVDVPVNGTPESATTPSFSTTADLTANVDVKNQTISNNNVTIANVTSAGPGWLVVHADKNGPSTVLGQTWVSHGENKEVNVSLNIDSVTHGLFAMLHKDLGIVGTYEFPGGADVPVNGSSPVTTPKFYVPIVHVDNQSVVDNTVTIRTVASSGPGWLVLHNSTGEVVGVSAVNDGNNDQVIVQFTAPWTSDLNAMLHKDLGVVGTYEFPGGADVPVNAGETATNPLFGVTGNLTSLVEVDDQFTVNNAVIIKRVVNSGSAWIVIHADNSGPSTVLGKTWIPHGDNADVSVKIDTSVQTPVLYAMLHIDNGTIGTYEFPGVDVPVNGSSSVTTPSFTNIFVDVENQTLTGDVVSIKRVVSAGPGWLVIHADNNGAPGTVLGKTAVNDGENLNVKVTLATSGRTTTLFAMLHKDLGTVGTYEFPGVDVPFNGSSPVTTPSFKATPTSTTSAPTSTTSAPTSTTSAPTTTTQPPANGSGFEFVVLLLAIIGVVFLRRKSRTIR